MFKKETMGYTIVFTGNDHLNRYVTAALGAGIDSGRIVFELIEGSKYRFQLNHITYKEMGRFDAIIRATELVLD